MKPIAYLTLNKIDYPIFKVKEGYVAVDENAEIKDGEYFYHEKGFVMKAKLYKPEKSLDEHVIIASTFPLEGVKRFEMADEAEIESQKHAKKEWPLRTYSKQFEACKNDFKSGYKAAQSKGSFTEEQMQACWLAATRKTVEPLTEAGYSKFMDSLLPRYEVEMEAKTTWIDENQGITEIRY